MRASTLSPAPPTAPPGGTHTPGPAAPVVASVDGELVTRACAGEEIAFELLVVKYQRRAASEIRRVVYDAAIVEELTQDAFMRAYDGLPDLQDRDRFWPWLRTISRNVASSYLRSGQNRLDDRPVDPEADSTIAAFEQHASHGSVEDELAARQLFEALRRAVGALPERQRAAIVLTYYEELSNAAAAQALDMNIKAFESLLFRARAALRKAFEAQGDAG
jgi:RNA polymerase sigma-70 factor (ECF subfamily)